MSSSLESRYKSEHPILEIVLDAVEADINLAIGATAFIMHLYAGKTYPLETLALACGTM